MLKIMELPKVELHCHLDGSVRPSTIIDLAKKQGKDLPTWDEESINEKMIAPMECENLEEYLERFDLPVLVMQTKDSLQRIAYELMEDGAKENIKYMEIRFAPTHHTKEGLSIQEVIQSVVNGVKAGEKDFDIKGNVIISMLRFLPPSTADEVIEKSREFLGRGVVAVDLAANEDPGFSHHYVDAFKRARQYGFKVTIHAGEQGCGQNVYDAVTLLDAERIGHGVYIKNHKEAYELVKEKAIIIEACPTSNVQTKAVTALNDHPVCDFSHDGIKVTINTDNRTVSNTTMSREIERVHSSLNMSKDEYTKMYMNAVDGAFTDDATKEWLRKQI